MILSSSDKSPCLVSTTLLGPDGNQLPVSAEFKMCSGGWTINIAQGMAVSLEINVSV